MTSRCWPYFFANAALQPDSFCQCTLLALRYACRGYPTYGKQTDPIDPTSEGDGVALEIIIPVAAALALLMVCACFCCYRHRKGKEGRADQMRRNLGYTPDMEAKGDGNFGPTNKHVAITRGGGPQVTPEMLATQSYQPNYAAHQRAPSEAPSSIIEDNIANNYRPKKAAKVWRRGGSLGGRGCRVFCLCVWRGGGRGVSWALLTVGILCMKRRRSGSEFSNVCFCSTRSIALCTVQVWVCFFCSGARFVCTPLQGHGMIDINSSACRGHRCD